MRAYILVDIEVIDKEHYPEYLEKITPTVYSCGGRYLTRGANTERLSGGWNPGRLVIMEFPSREVALHWATCSDNAPIHALRNRYAKANMVLVEGSVDFS